MDTEDIGPVDTSTKQCTDYLMNYNAIAYFLGAQHKSMVENKSWTSYSLDDDDSTESAKIECSVDSIQLPHHGKLDHRIRLIGFVLFSFLYFCTKAILAWKH